MSEDQQPHATEGQEARSYADFLAIIEAAARDSEGPFLSRSRGEEIWKQLLEYAQSTGAADFRSDERFQSIREELFLRLLDFRTQPASATAPEPDSYDEIVIPRMFLQGPPGLEESGYGARQLARFLEICGPKNNQARDGVFLVSGVRGSGKTRLLRLLRDAYHVHWASPDGNAESPIWLTVDLGQKFEPSQFMRDILNAVSERVRRRYYYDTRQMPFSLYAHRIAAWCRNNAAWAFGSIAAMLILLIPAFLDGIDLRRRALTTKGMEMIQEWAVTDHPILIFGENWFHVVLLALFLCIWVLAVAAGNSKRRAARYFQYVPVLLLLGSVYFAASIAWASRSPSLAIVTVVLILIAIVGWRTTTRSHPQWRSLLEHIDSLSARIRNETTGAPVNVPYFSNMLSQLLPTRTFEPIAEMSLPFLEEQVRELVSRTVEAHGRVAFLVDDVDAIPAEHFHEVLRAFRPLAKLPGVVVVIAVPEHFYPAYMSVEPNDLHSTAEDFYFLGPPTLYELSASGCVRPRSDLTTTKLLEGHLAFVWWNDHWREPLSEETLRAWRGSSVFRELCGLWATPADERLVPLPKDHVLMQILHSFGGSYREFLRLTRELMRPRAMSLERYWQERQDSTRSLESTAASVLARATVLHPSSSAKLPLPPLPENAEEASPNWKEQKAYANGQGAAA